MQNTNTCTQNTFVFIFRSTFQLNKILKRFQPEHTCALVLDCWQGDTTVVFTCTLTQRMGQLDWMWAALINSPTSIIKSFKQQWANLHLAQSCICSRNTRWGHDGLPQSEGGPTASLTALHQCRWLLQQVGILHLSMHQEALWCNSNRDFNRNTVHLDVCCVCWREWVTPHQRTAVSGEGCALAPSVPESSFSVLPGWCWSPSAHFPTFQRWPAEQSEQSV